jgi:hypothetical protein
MALAGRWPGPAPEWLALAIALVESEWISRCCRLLSWYHLRASSIAMISVSKATCFPLRVLEP